MSVTDVREWAREQGFELGAKGRIPKAVQARYDLAHSASSADGDDTRPGHEPDADYDGGVTEADFPGGDDLNPFELFPPGGADGPERAVEERQPRSVRPGKGAAAKAFTERLWGGKGKEPARRKRYPRVPLQTFGEDVWLDLAWAFQAAPPLEKILYLQAPLAGQILDDTVKGTVADRVLQPVARIDRQFKAVEALTAPAWVAAIMMRGARDPESGEYSPETKLMFGGLRHALLSMSRVVDFDLDKMKGKAQELKSASGQIDAMIEWLFAVAEEPGDHAPANGHVPEAASS